MFRRKKKKNVGNKDAKKLKGPEIEGVTRSYKMTNQYTRGMFYQETCHSEANSLKAFFAEKRVYEKKLNKRYQEASKDGWALYAITCKIDNKIVCFFRNYDSERISVGEGLSEEIALDLANRLKRKHKLLEIQLVGGRVPGLQILLNKGVFFNNLKAKDDDNSFEYIKRAYWLDTIQIEKCYFDVQPCLPNFYRFKRITTLRLFSVKYHSSFSRLRLSKSIQSLTRLTKLEIKDNYENNTSNHLNYDFVLKGKCASEVHPWLLLCCPLTNVDNCEVKCSRGALKNKSDAVYWLKLMRGVHCFKEVKLTEHFPFLKFRVADHMANYFLRNIFCA